jgi:hypothetical protein
MQSIFKLLLLLVIVQSNASAIGSQFLAIPHSPYELVNGYNPAFTNIYAKPEIAVSHGNWLADMTVSSINYNSSLFKGWGGLTLRYVALNDLELRTERPTDDPLAFYNSSAIAVDGRYTIQFGFGFVSTTFRYISIQLYNEESSGIAVDLNFRKKINDRFNIGLALLNVGTMSEFYEKKPSLPLRTVIGTTYEYSLGRINNTLSAAIENSTFVNSVIFRASHNSDFDSVTFQIGTQVTKNNLAVSGGLQVHLGRFMFGYAVQIGTQSLGVPQYLNLSVILP